MKSNELKVNEMELVTGGNFLDDAKDILKEIFPNPLALRKPVHPIMPEIIVAAK